MTVRCEKCRGTIGEGSAFAVKMGKHGKHLLTDIVKAKSLKEGDLAMHMNGDRQCAKPISGWKQKLVDTLGFQMKIDTDFLDYL